MTEIEKLQDLLTEERRLRQSHEKILTAKIRELIDSRDEAHKAHIAQIKSDLQKAIDEIDQSLLKP